MDDIARLSLQIHELKGSMLAMECFVNSLTEALSSDARVVVQAFYASESDGVPRRADDVDGAGGDGRRVRARRAARPQAARRERRAHATPPERARRAVQPMQVRFFPVRLAS